MPSGQAAGQRVHSYLRGRASMMKRGTAAVPAAKAPPHASAEVAATHRAAEVSAAHAPAPMTGCVATGRNGVGRDDGTSQCHGNNDDRDSMQRGFPHDGYLRSK